MPISDDENDALIRRLQNSKQVVHDPEALIYAAGTLTTDDDVFGEASDLILLGARSLEGLNVRIDPVSKRLVDAGPMPLAVAAA